MARSEINRIIRAPTMKLAATVLAALIALAAVEGHNLPDFGEGPLHEDIQYFLDMIPFQDIATVVLEYAADDAEFQEALAYMQTQDFKELIAEIEAIPEFVEFLNYLEQNNVHMYDLLNRLNDLTGLDHLAKPYSAVSEDQITGGLAGLFQDVKKYVSYDSIIHGYVFKMRTSEAFVDFVRVLKSSKNQQFVNHLYSNERYLDVRAKLVATGLDVALIEDVCYVVLGLTFPVLEFYNVENELSKDLDEFAVIAFTPKIMNIIMHYLAFDEETNRALEYVKSEKFYEMVRSIESLKEYKNLVIDLYNAGLDVFTFVQQFHDFIGMEEFVPPIEKPALNGKYRSMIRSDLRITGGVKGLVDDVKAELPIDELRALYEKKMRTSKVFADFIGHLHSEELQNIVTAFYTHEIYLEMRSKAIAIGLDLEAIADLLHTMFGLNFPKP